MVRVLIAFVLAASAAVAAEAQPDSSAQRDYEQTPGRTLTPLLTLRNAGFDSNVFRSQEAQGDWTATLSPELAAAWRLGRARFTANAALDLVYFQQFDTERSLDTHDRIRVEWPVGRNRLTAAYTFLNTRQRVDDDLDARVRRIEQGAWIRLDRRLGAKTSVDIALRRDLVDVADDVTAPADAILHRVLARAVSTVTLSARYAATPRTALAVLSEQDRTEFDTSPLRDSSGLRIGPRVTFMSPGPLGGHAFVGYRRFDIADPYVADFSGGVASADLHYVMFDATSVGIAGDRDVAYSSRVDEPYYVRSVVRVFVTHRVGHAWGVTAGIGKRRADYRQTTNVSLPAPGKAPTASVEHVSVFDTTVSRELSRSTRLGIELEYDRRTSESKPRRDYDRVRIGTVLRYAF